MPARRPVSVYTMIMTVSELMPDRRLALLFTPTDSTKVPKAVFLTNTAMAMHTTVMIMIGMGIGPRCPCPITRKGEYMVVNCLPFVRIWAIPRPLTIRIRVAMNGCIPPLEIRIPLKSPISMQVRRGSRIAIQNG